MKPTAAHPTPGPLQPTEKPGPYSPEPDPVPKPPKRESYPFPTPANLYLSEMFPDLMSFHPAETCIHGFHGAVAA